MRSLSQGGPEAIVHATGGIGCTITKEPAQ